MLSTGGLLLPRCARSTYGAAGARGDAPEPGAHRATSKARSFKLAEYNTRYLGTLTPGLCHGRLDEMGGQMLRNGPVPNPRRS